MTLFDLSDYHVRQLDPAQGTKPLDFGGGGITGSINLDGRFIAINTYHPEHGYITLTSIPPFPDEDRYDQAKVRAYRKSLVHNEGFGLQFEQEIIKREYFLIEDAVPFIRFTLADSTIAECVTDGSVYARQEWKFSNSGIKATFTGNVWLMRTAYTQLTEGGVLHMPDKTTKIDVSYDKHLVIKNQALETFVLFPYLINGTENNDGSINLKNEIIFDEDYRIDILPTRRIWELEHGWFEQTLGHYDFRSPLSYRIKDQTHIPNNLILKRATVYARICSLSTADPEASILTDHMILPLSWNRDAYYVTKVLSHMIESSYYLDWLLESTWRGTYCRSLKTPIADGWGRSYMANGQQKDSRSFQLDQQIFPLLAIADNIDEEYEGDDISPEEITISREASKTHLLPYILRILKSIKESQITLGLCVTDETPADDDIPLNFHFTSHILLWYALKRIKNTFPKIEESVEDYPENFLQFWKHTVQEQILKHFITEHNEIGRAHV